MRNTRCNAQKFELRSFPKTDEDNLHVFNQELDALIRLQHISGVATLMDLIEDDSGFYLLLSKRGQSTLRRILEQIPQDSEDLEDFARDTVKRLCKIVDRMHSKNVMHRGLNLGRIMVRQSEGTFKVACITNFDFALHLQNRWMVQQ